MSTNLVSKPSSEKTKALLYWNNHPVLSLLFSRHANPEVLAQAGCPIKNCIFTDDLEHFNQISDVVLFFAASLFPAPSHRFYHQHFVFFELESPFNNRLQHTYVTYDSLQFL